MPAEAAEVRYVEDTAHYAAKCVEYQRLLGLANARIDAMQLRHTAAERTIADLKRRVAELEAASEDDDRELANADLYRERVEAAERAWAMRFETTEAD